MVYGGALANRISYICDIHEINTAASTGMHVVPTLRFPWVCDTCALQSFCRQ